MIAWFDRFVLFLTTRAPLQGRAGVDSCRDAPAFPGEREGFTRLNDKASGRLREMAASTCRRQTVSPRSNSFAPVIMAPYTHYPLQKRTRTNNFLIRVSAI